MAPAGWLGPASQEVTNTESESCPGALCPGTANAGQYVTTTPSWRFGWAAGAGAEAKLWDSNWLVRLEYLHYDFGNSGGFSTTSSEKGDSYEPVSFTSGSLTVDVVRAGLSYKFGGPY
jgi:opacity protein-like surface antigen